MVELAFTHLGYFLKVASKKLIFFVCFFFFLVLQFVLKLAFVAFPCLKWCFNKALIGHRRFVSVLAHELYHFLHCRYSVGESLFIRLHCTCVWHWV